MATQTVGGMYQHHGLNESAVAYVYAVVGTTNTATDTVLITMPEGLDLNICPIYAVGVKGASTTLTYQKMDLTSFDSLTGIITTTVPAAGALTAGDRVFVAYVGRGK